MGDTAPLWVQLVTAFFGGAGAIVVWEGLVKPRRERRTLARLLLAEVVRTERYCELMLGQRDQTNVVPDDFHISTTLLDSVINRIGELDLETIGALVGLHAKIGELNRVPGIYAERTRELERREPDLTPEARAEMLGDVKDAFFNYLHFAHRSARAAGVLLGGSALEYWWLPSLRRSRRKAMEKAPAKPLPHSTP